MNKIKGQSNMFNVNSNLSWVQNQLKSKDMFYDVYSVYKVKKHYRWCLGSVQKGLKNLAFSLSIAPKAQSVEHYLQATGPVEETLAEKVAVAFAFSAAVLLVCFSAFVVF